MTGGLIIFKKGLFTFTESQRDNLETRVANYKLKSKLIITRNLFQKFVEQDYDLVLKAKTKKERYRRLNFFTSALVLEYSKTLGVPLEPKFEEYAKGVLKGRDNAIDKESIARKKRENAARSLASKQKEVLDKVRENITFEEIYKKTKPYHLKRPRQYFDECENVYTAKEKVQSILGRFVGDLLYTSGTKKGKKDEIEIFADYDILDGKLTGELNVILRRKGREYSNLRDRGVSIIKEHRDYLNDIIIEVGPEMFIQIYYIQYADMFIGSFYEEGNHRGLIKIFPQT